MKVVWLFLVQVDRRQQWWTVFFLLKTDIHMMVSGCRNRTNPGVIPVSQSIREHMKIDPQVHPQLSSVKNLQVRKLYGDETKLGPRKWNPRPRKRAEALAEANVDRPIAEGPRKTISMSTVILVTIVLSDVARRDIILNPFWPRNPRQLSGSFAEAEPAHPQPMWMGTSGC